MCFLVYSPDTQMSAIVAIIIQFTQTLGCLKGIYDGYILSELLFTNNGNEEGVFQLLRLICFSLKVSVDS